MALRRPQQPRASVCRGDARTCSRRLPTATAISATARPNLRIGPVSISMHAVISIMRALEALGVPREERFLHLRTVGLHARSDGRPRGAGRRAGSHPHRDVRRRSVHDARRCRRAAPAAASAGRSCRPGAAGIVRAAAASMSAGAPRSTTCSNSPKPAMCRCDGHAEPASAITARADLSPERSSYRPDPVDAPADGNVLICCAQPEGDVVLDL